MTKKFSNIRSTLNESESVKRTQTNIKNTERAQSGFHIDPDEYAKHVERMKKQNAEYVKNNPNSIYKVSKEEFDFELDEEWTPEQIDTVKVIFSTVKSVDKTSGRWRNLVKNIKNLSTDQLKSLVNVPFIGDEAKKLLHENVEQIDEISDELANAVARKRYTAARNNRKDRVKNMASAKNFKQMMSREQRKRRLNPDTPETAKIKSDANAEYEYNKKNKLSNESYELDEAKSDYQVYHSSYSGAVQHARKKLEDKGYTIHDDDWFHNVNSGPKKPSEGKTNSLHIPLHKDGKLTKKHAHIQVYNRGNDVGNNYELNMYHESYDIQEQSLDATTPSVESIAKKHGKSVEYINKQLEIGTKVEREHSSNVGKEKEIALDHLGEKPDYYTKLNKYVEAFSPSATNKTHDGSFVEKEHGKTFTYKKTDDAWAKKHNLPHEIDVHDGVRYGHVKGTVAHVATDENDDGTPKIEKWNLKNHNKWVREDLDKDTCWKGYEAIGTKKKNGKTVPNCVPVNESRAADIIREAWKDAKKKKSKNVKEEDKDDDGMNTKPEKFESDPILTDTIDKQ